MTGPQLPTAPRGVREDAGMTMPRSPRPGEAVNARPRSGTDVGADEVVDIGAGRGPAWLDAFLAAQLRDVVALRRRIHAHPELSLREFATTALIGDTLQAAGIDITELPGGTGLIAEVGPRGPAASTAGGAPRDVPVIGLRADIDALPLREESGLPFASTTEGVTHACGHDVHTAVVVGAALALASAPVLPGRVRLLFQPGEEVMEGSRRLLSAGAVDGMDICFAMHCDPSIPVGTVGLKTGPITSATDILEIELTGAGGHTSRPHLTVDLVAALSTLATQLPASLARRLDPRAGATLVWGSIHAGETFNVIPERGRLTGTLRLLDRAAWECAEDLVGDLVAQLVAPTGAGYRLRYVRGVPPVVNDAAAVSALHAGVSAGLGAGSVGRAPQSTGAEDFALLLEHVPGALARLGVWDGAAPQVDLHSPTFRADERCLAAGVRALVHTVLAACADR